jgi:hypothetical protein
MVVKWNGDKLIKKKNAIIANAINETVVDSIKYALNHHPNWQNRTLLAEGSITQKKFATAKDQSALWGSVWTNPGANYVWYLEFNHPPFLRASADVNYKNLPKLIRQGFRKKK